MVEIWQGIMVPLPGETAANVPELAGQIIEDELRDFVVTDQSGVQRGRGKLQDRVVRSDATGYLDYYFRIAEFAQEGDRDLVALGLTRYRWPYPVSYSRMHDVGYRVDGLGSFPPTHATWIIDMFMITFSGGTYMPTNTDSNFMYIRTDTTRYRVSGESWVTTMLLPYTAGDESMVAHLPCFIPIY